MKATKSLAAVAAGVAMAAVLTAPAGAAEREADEVGTRAVLGPMYTTDPNHTGGVAFETNGDIIAVQDYRGGDARSAIASVFEYVDADTRGERIYSVRDEAGGGATTAGASDHTRYNLVEGRRYWLRIALISPEGDLSWQNWAWFTNTDS